MTTWIPVTANFILILLLLLYVAAAYASMWARRWEAGFTRCMGTCRYLLHGVGFLVLILATHDYRIIPLYLLELAFFIMADIIQRRVYAGGMLMLYQNMMLLLSVGFVMLTRLSFAHAMKQFLMAVLAFCLCTFLPWVFRKIPGLWKFGVLYSLVGPALLLAVLFLGSEVFGAKNWLTIKQVTFQPSEFVKLTFILSMAALLVRETKHKYRNLVLVTVVAVLHVGLLALSNDFGGALIFFVIYVLMLFVVSGDVLFPTAAILAGSFAALFAYRYSGHIRELVLAWQNPFLCIEDEGYQMAQSLFSIGSGGWFGTGLTKGMPKTVPVVKSDFIFSAVAEELGAVAAALLLCVYINCIIQMLSLALERKQSFFFAVTTGAVVLFGIQLFFNVGGVIKLIPSTGVTLTCISYGGSSLCSTIILFQGLQAMRAVEEKEKKQRRKEKCSGQQYRMVSVCAMLLLLLCVMTSYFLTVTVKEAKANYYNEYNQRIRRLEETTRKGKILSADGLILAGSILGEDGIIYRLYPYGEMTTAVTGQMVMGRTGLEKSFGKEMYTVGLDFLERLKGELSGEVPEGNSVVTTIDMDLQRAAYEALEGYTGAIGVLEVKTGKLLAIVSTPTYNPNELSVVWEEVSSQSDAPFLNRLTGGLYPPGSTFKLVTTMAYLQNHKEEEFSYTCTGTARFRNTIVHCYNEKAHGTQNLQQAFANSCNTAYAYLGEQISDEEYNRVAQTLGFGTIWNQTLPYEKSSFSLTEDTDDAVRVQTSFGQGETLVTPFQLLMLGASIANGGKVPLPYLVQKVQNCKEEVLKCYTAGGQIDLMPEETSLLLKEYMIAASADKMKEFAEQGITVAGKTGSAEASTGTHSWYLCFAPADNPELAIVVLMENAGTGSKSAVPAAKRLLEVYFTDEK